MPDHLEVQIKEAIELALRNGLVTDVVTSACGISFNGYDDSTVDALLQATANYGRAGIYVSFASDSRKEQMGYVEKKFKCQIQARIAYEDGGSSIDWDVVRTKQGAVDAEIEAVMYTDDTWGGLAFQTEYIEDEHYWSDKGATDVITNTVYLITYHHKAGDPYTAC